MNNSMNMIPRQRRIGLTGGVASGKTTIANYISKTKNIKILDADIYSRKLIKSNTKQYDKIISHFGKQILDISTKELEINKQTLKKIIIKDPNQRQWLEKLLHPLIKENIIKDCNKFKNEKVLLLVAPLLFEAKFDDMCTEIWLVKCGMKEQLKRLLKRDELNVSEAKQLINLQLSYSAKAKQVKVILDNSNAQEKWKKEVESLI